MPANAPEVIALLDELRERAADVGRLLDEALVCQWQASPAPRPREDTTERSKGGPPSDPTGDVVLDDRRLALRSAVDSAALSLRVAKAGLGGAHRRLEEALRAWEGA